VAQLEQARLIDTYQVIVHPIVLGSGKSMFASVKDTLNPRLKNSRPFGNGNVVLGYEPSA
jgi:dihydrofolate reductase